MVGIARHLMIFKTEERRMFMYVCVYVYVSVGACVCEFFRQGMHPCNDS